MEMELGARIIIRFSNGVYITETTCWAVIVAVAMIVFALIATRNLKRNPKGLQAVCELIVEYVYKFVGNTMGKHNLVFAPYIGTLFFFLILCNALGLIGQRAATADMNFTFAMGILVFFLIQYNSIKSKGIKGYLTHFAEPFPFMIPIKIIEELVFPVSLSFRIFGNILAGVIIVELYMHLMHSISDSLHLPIPLFQAVTPLPVNAFFDIFEPFLQAFVFSMLTMSFIARAIVVHNKE
ncbi:MAG: F0F1 ATP synthase subunit A [Clostridiales bacterium]|nr:F0F1 ATP synthase subunit A [Clostridiales bacterium]